MKIQDQCISLELAKKLKSLNVKQDSLFSYILYVGMTANGYELKQTGWKMEDQEFISAFTGIELMQFIPEEITISKLNNLYYYLWTNKKVSKESGKPEINAIDKDYANGLADILIQLIENKEIEVP